MLRGKIILVAGGGSGIGLEVARLALKQGAGVIIASRSAVGRAEALAAELGAAVTCAALDITSDDSCRALFQGVAMVDHMVVTARSEAVGGPFAPGDDAPARATFETKFWGQCRLARAAVGHIAPLGSITLTSGIAGAKVFPGAWAMAAVNAATEALCRSLAVELAPLRVNAVSPGFVEPKPDAVRQVARRFPLGRCAAPAEVAACYLALINNPYQTGCVNVVDGGALWV